MPLLQYKQSNKQQYCKKWVNENLYIKSVKYNGTYSMALHLKCYSLTDLTSSNTSISQDNQYQKFLWAMKKDMTWRIYLMEIHVDLINGSNLMNSRCVLHWKINICHKKMCLYTC